MQFSGKNSLRWSALPVVCVSARSARKSDAEVHLCMLHTGCMDNNMGLKKDSNGHASTCAAVKAYCDDATHGSVVQRNCPQTCDMCDPEVSAPGVLVNSIFLVMKEHICS